MAERFKVSTRRWVRDLKTGLRRDIPPGIRIELLADGCEEGMLITTKSDDLCFGRTRDCEAAIAALEREGLTTRATLIAAGLKRIKQVAVEAMQW